MLLETNHYNTGSLKSSNWKYQQRETICNMLLAQKVYKKGKKLFNNLSKWNSMFSQILVFALFKSSIWVISSTIVFTKCRNGNHEKVQIIPRKTIFTHVSTPFDHLRYYLRNHDLDFRYYMFLGCKIIPLCITKITK